MTLDLDSSIGSLVSSAENFDERLIDINLNPLTDEDGHHLVDQLLTNASPEVNALKRRIADLAEGNPFFIEEIIRMLIDQDGLQFTDGRWHVGPNADLLMKDVPATLNGLVLARLDRLPDELRQTLQKIAVLGSDFPLESAPVHSVV